MKQLGFREWMLVAVLMFGVSLPLYAQPTQLTQTERKNLDSLLYAVDFEQLRTVLERKNRQVQSFNVDDSTWANYRQQTREYNRVWETVASIKAREPDYIKDYVTHRLGQQVLYQAVRTGHRAAELYDAFERLVKDGAFVEAVGYYEAANFFRTAHLLGIARQLDAHYSRALVAFEGGYYLLARSTIDSVRIHFGSINALHQPWIDKLDRLSLNVERMQMQKEREELNWGRRERPSFTAGISLGGQILTRRAVGPLTLQLAQDERTVFTIEEKFKKSFAQGFGLEATAFFGSRWVLGGGFMYANYKYSGASNTGAFTFDFALKSRVAHVFARYTLRPEVGLRPYLRVGGGVVQTDRETSEVIVIDNLPGQEPLVYHYQLEVEESPKGTQARVGLGIEYVSCAKCMFVVGADLNVVRNFMKSDWLSIWQSLLSFRIGLYL